MVVTCHFRGAFLQEFTALPEYQQTLSVKIFYFINRLGAESVLIFFVLSGFLVGGRAIERLRYNSFKVGNYAIDRFVRIMLPLSSLLIIYIPVSYWIEGSVDWNQWFCALFSLEGVWGVPLLGVTWSLAYEVWFYVIMAGIGLIWTKTSDVRTVTGILILFTVCLIFTKLNAIYLLIWMIGAFAYVFRPSKFNKYALILSFLGLSLTTVCLQLTSDSKFQMELDNILPTTNWYAWAMIFSFCSCVFIQQLILAKPASRFMKWVDNAGTKLAAFSYTLYLTHILVMRVLQELGAERSAQLSLESVSLWILWVLIALVVAWALYLCFESHTKICKVYLKGILLNRFDYKRSTQKAKIIQNS